ncbi:MAG: tetratricopeptide repeat protein [Terriglobales bacterium]
MSFRFISGSLWLAVVFAVAAVAQSSPDAACAACHKKIYDSYQQTIMAKASGKAADGLVTGDFFHQPSRVKYRVFEKDGRTWMSYEREPDPKLKGQRELLYYVGSGRKGRSYLFSVQGFLFETPINWYSQEGCWNMAPAYTEARQSPINLPSLVDCLNCHTSGLQAPIPGTENRFAGRPFLHDGITCERCHGSTAQHADGKGPIINPAKLDPERRNSVCMECHFEGNVAVEQPGKRLYEFQPGEKLSDYIHYFLLTGTPSTSVKAVSQWEALSLSVCKQRSGDKMSCTSCHDPHFEPSAQDKTAYFRGKCLACHGEPFAAKHHPGKPGCTDCHMPKLPSKDVAHTQATDHEILRRPRVQLGQLQDASPEPRLVAFPANERGKESSRDLGLAWETLAQRHIEGASANAERYLRRAMADNPNDPVVLTALGYIEQKHGRSTEARDLYERALKLDPLNNDAATNLGVLEAGEGHLARAVQLWQGAFDRLPHRSAIGINLAMAFCGAGQVEQGRRYVERVLDFNPDSPEAQRLLQHMNGDPVSCKP